MPVGNITPKTDSLTLNGMLLGAEEYPSSIQQAGESNTGYLLHRPGFLAGDFGTTWDIYTNPGTHHGYGYLVAGKYVLIGALSTNITSGTAWVKVDGTAVVSFAGSDPAGTACYTELDGFVQASDGVVAITAYGSGGLNTNMLSRWSVWFRQYE